MTDANLTFDEWRQQGYEKGFWSPAVSPSHDELKQMLRLLIVFEENWFCESCRAKSAYWLEGCTNPLHQLQEALWELDQKIVAGNQPFLVGEKTDSKTDGSSP